MNKRIRIIISLLLVGGSLIQTPGQQEKPMPSLVAGSPPGDACIGLSLLETGEIRHYNYGEQAEPGSFYLSGADKGFTWKREKSNDHRGYETAGENRTRVLRRTAGKPHGIRLHVGLVAPSTNRWAMGYHTGLQPFRSRFGAASREMGLPGKPYLHQR